MIGDYRNKACLLQEVRDAPYNPGCRCRDVHLKLLMMVMWMMVESRQARYRHRLQSTVYLYGCIHISLHEMATASAEVPLNGVKGCGRFLNTAPHSCHMTVGSLECVSDDSRPRAFFAPLTIWTSGLGPSSDSSFIGPWLPPPPPILGLQGSSVCTVGQVPTTTSP